MSRLFKRRDERTGGGKWKIEQCSVGPETAIVKRQISDPVQGGGDGDLDGHDPLLAAHTEGGALVECDPSPPDDYDYDYQVDYQVDYRVDYNDKGRCQTILGSLGLCSKEWLAGVLKFLNLS